MRSTSSRTAVITGAGGGLGKALCTELRQRGFKVVGTDVRGADRVLDVTNAEACHALAREIEPDVWINNAGVLGAGSAVDQPLHDVEAVIAVNLLGVIHGSRAAASIMRLRRSGHILNVGSLASWFAPMGQAVYAASKHGMRAYSVALAAELLKSNVHVSVLCPDGVRTPMLEGREHDPHAAMSFTGAELLDAHVVAKVAADLLERPRLMAFVPEVKGFGARLIGALPRLNVAATRLLAMQGLRAQQRLRRNLEPSRA